VVRGALTPDSGSPDACRRCATGARQSGEVFSAAGFGLTSPASRLAFDALLVGPVSELSAHARLFGSGMPAARQSSRNS
jgi:hypothetical protein